MNDIIPFEKPEGEILYQQFHITLPEFFDPQGIVSDMRRIQDKGLLGKYVFALTRKFSLAQEVKIINGWAKYFVATKFAVEAVQGIQQSNAKHQVEMAQQHSAFQQAKAERAEFRAREAEAVLRQVEAVERIERIVNPRPKPAPDNIYEKHVDNVLRQSGQSLEAKLRVIDSSALSDEGKRRLVEALEQKEFEEANRDEL